MIIKGKTSEAVLSVVLAVVAMALWTAPVQAVNTGAPELPRRRRMLSERHPRSGSVLTGDGSSALRRRGMRAWLGMSSSCPNLWERKSAAPGHRRTQPFILANCRSPCVPGPHWCCHCWVSLARGTKVSRSCPTTTLPFALAQRTLPIRPSTGGRSCRMRTRQRSFTRLCFGHQRQPTRTGCP